jgi:hypothetical protein
VANNEAGNDAVETTSTPAPTKAEARAAELKSKRDKREAEKAARKAANAEKRANGVIGTLHQMLMQPNGVTKKEVLAALTERFPDRDPIGMATTVGIQLSRLQKKHGKIVSRKQGERGLVYGYELLVKFAPEASEGAPAQSELVAKVVERDAANAEQEAPAAPKAQAKGKGGKKR